jgi:hypothetical protein
MQARETGRYLKDKAITAKLPNQRV